MAALNYEYTTKCSECNSLNVWFVAPSEAISYADFVSFLVEKIMASPELRGCRVCQKDTEQDTVVLSKQPSILMR